MKKKNIDIKQIDAELSEEIIIDNKKIEEKLVNFSRALKNYRNQEKWKAHLMEDKDIVELFVKIFIPSLEATQEEWNKVFKKF